MTTLEVDVYVQYESGDPAPNKTVSVFLTTHFLVPLPNDSDEEQTDDNGHACFTFEYEPLTVEPDAIKIYVDSEEYGPYPLHPLDEPKSYTVTLPNPFPM